jgi:hypothetical protein
MGVEEPETAEIICIVLNSKLPRRRSGTPGHEEHEEGI